MAHTNERLEFSQRESNTHRSVAIFSKFMGDRSIATPCLHAVLGSGIGTALQDEWLGDDWETAGALHFSELPSLCQASAPGHPGIYRFVRHRKSQRVVCLQVGRLHGYEGLHSADVVRTVLIPAAAGVRRFVLTNAAGGLHADWPVGSVMMIRDHVNLTGANPLIGTIERGVDGIELGPRFPDLSQVYSIALTETLRQQLENSGLQVYEGVYLGLMGPNFETPAEVRLFSNWGLDAVGMSTVWESIALNHFGAEVAGFSLISNVACGLLPHEKIDHTAVLDVGRIAARKMINALLRCVLDLPPAQG